MNIIYKTIKTRNRHYVYDRNANRILSIDESDYNKLLEQEKSKRQIIPRLANNRL